MTAAVSHAELSGSAFSSGVTGSIHVNEFVQGEDGLTEIRERQRLRFGFRFVRLARRALLKPGIDERGSARLRNGSTRRARTVNLQCMRKVIPYLVAALFLLHAPHSHAADDFQISEDDERIVISSPTLDAVVRKKGYVTGVAAGSFLDKKSGFRDAGYGLDIVDWIMEPGSDEAYRDQLPGDLAYLFNNSYHGKTPKRSIEGPQICTKANELSPRVVRGEDFVAVTSSFKYQIAAPGKKTGSEWSQVLVFPAGQRYFISSDKITSVNASDAMFLRIDMPGHIKHKQGDTFSEVYLSYVGTDSVERVRQRLCARREIQLSPRH